MPWWTLACRVRQDRCNLPKRASVQSCARTVTETARPVAGRSVTNGKIVMKRLYALALSLSLLGGLSPALLRAADADTAVKKQPKATEEQRKLRKEMLEKYDANKDGKLDKQERAKFSKEDKEKLEKAGLGRKAKKAGKAADKTDKKAPAK